jgi:hypothetical protein
MPEAKLETALFPTDGSKEAQAGATWHRWHLGRDG